MCVSVRDGSWSAARRKWGPETRARVTPSILSQQLEKGCHVQKGGQWRLNACVPIGLVPGICQVTIPRPKVSSRLKVQDERRGQPTAWACTPTLRLMVEQRPAEKGGR